MHANRHTYTHTHRHAHREMSNKMNERNTQLKEKESFMRRAIHRTVDNNRTLQYENKREVEREYDKICNEQRSDSIDYSQTHKDGAMSISGNEMAWLQERIHIERTMYYNVQLSSVGSLYKNACETNSPYTHTYSLTNIKRKSITRRRRRWWTQQRCVCVKSKIDERSVAYTICYTLDEWGIQVIYLFKRDNSRCFSCDLLKLFQKKK